MKVKIVRKPNGLHDIYTKIPYENFPFLSRWEKDAIGENMTTRDVLDFIQGFGVSEFVLELKD